MKLFIKFIVVTALFWFLLFIAYPFFIDFIFVNAVYPALSGKGFPWWFFPLQIVLLFAAFFLWWKIINRLLKGFCQLFSEEDRNDRAY